MHPPKFECEANDWKKCQNRCTENLVGCIGIRFEIEKKGRVFSSTFQAFENAAALCNHVQSRLQRGPAVQVFPHRFSKKEMVDDDELVRSS